MKLLYYICFFVLNKLRGGTRHWLKTKLGYCGKNAEIYYSSTCMVPGNIYLHENSHILHDFQFISYTGKFIMKKNSGAAQGLTVITGNHQRIPGILLKEGIASRIAENEKDIVVDEDVWIGANVTLMNGCHIGRGAIIGACSTVRTSIPPYAIVIGNPAKIIGFVFTPEEIIEHEKKNYKEEERFPLDILEKNYEKYFLKRIDEIRKFNHY